MGCISAINKFKVLDFKVYNYEDNLTFYMSKMTVID